MSNSSSADGHARLLKARRILGIDPGLRLTGYGVIDVQGLRHRYIASGTITSGSGTLGQRLGRIFDGILEVSRSFTPTEAAIEKVFVNLNPQSTLLLGQARGAAITALVYAGLAVSEHTALRIKKAVVGYGHADKEQVQSMVVRLLSLEGTPSPDAADALACAICQAHHPVADV